MAFDETKLTTRIEQDDTAPVRVEDSFDETALTTRNKQLEDVAPIEKEDPSISASGKQDALLNFIDFFAPDDLVRALRTDESILNTSLPWFHSFKDPKAAELDRQFLAESVGQQYRPIGGLKTPHARAAAATVGQLGDPLTYVGAGTLKGVVKVGVASLFPSYTASVAGEQAVKTAQQFDVGETGQQAIGVGVGLLTGTVTGLTQAPIAYTAKKAGGAMAGLRNRIANRDEFIKDVVEVGHENLRVDMLNSQPDLIRTIEKAQRMAARLGVPDLQIARLAPLVANDQLNRDFESFYRSNTGFRESVNSAITEYNNVLKSYTSKFGGNPATQARKQAKAITDEKKRIGAQQKLVEDQLEDQQYSIEDRIAETSDRLNEKGDSVESGRQIENLIKAQEGLARKQLSMEYDKILKDAEDAGLEFPPEATEMLFNLNKNLRLDEMFGASTRLSVLINDLKPLKKDAPFEPLSVPQIDSFKREINRLLRGNLDSSQRETLKDLNKGFKQLLEETDADFHKLYGAADLKYLENIGVPYSAEGVASISRSKFSQSVVKKVMKPEIAQQLLAVAGDEGPSILRHSILIGLNDIMFKNGIIQPKAVERWLDKADNRLLLGMVDGLEDEVRDTSRLVKGMQEELAAVGVERELASRHQTDFLFESLGTSTDKVVGEMLNDAGKREKHLAGIAAMSSNNQTAVMDGVRQSMINKAMSQANLRDITIQEFINDPKHREAYVKVFGRSYFKGLEALAIIGDSMAELELPRLKQALKVRDKEAGKQTVGFGLSNVTAMWRRPFISAWQKITILSSMAGTRQFQNIKDQQLMRFILSKDTLDALGKAIDFKDGKATINKEGKEFLAVLAEVSGRGAYLGAKVTGSNLPVEDQETR
jgi:hypothetical protein